MKQPTLSNILYGFARTTHEHTEANVGRITDEVVAELGLGECTVRVLNRISRIVYLAVRGHYDNHPELGGGGAVE